MSLMRLVRFIMFAVICCLSAGGANADQLVWVHLTITPNLQANTPTLADQCTKIQQVLQTTNGSYTVDVSESGLYGWTVHYPSAPCNTWGTNPVDYAGTWEAQYWLLTGIIDGYSLTTPADTTQQTGTLDLGNSRTITYVKSLWTTVSLPTNTLTIAGAGNGGGTISGSGFNCIISGSSSAGTCSQSLSVGAQVSLTATPDSTSTFTGWSGCDTQNLAACNLTMKSGGQQVTASFFSSSLKIIKPTDSQVFNYLSEKGYTSTTDIPFIADPGASAGSTTVNWTANLEYQTSGGYRPYKETTSFSTVGNATRTAPYQSTGGKITLNANATLGGQLVSAKPVTFYVEGVRLPEPTVTAKLLSLYSGPTPNLLTGIAQKESSYQQFRQLTLYSQKGLWPNESEADDGSHIGLMQMWTELKPKNGPTQYCTPSRIWNWEQNAEDGAHWLTVDKMNLAKKLVGDQRKIHPSLPDLTAAQYEPYAVQLYGEGANGCGKWSQQYYVAIQSDPNNPNSAWTWTEGKSCQGGHAYVADVFAKLHK